MYSIVLDLAIVTGKMITVFKGSIFPLYNVKCGRECILPHYEALIILYLTCTTYYHVNTIHCILYVILLSQFVLLSSGFTVIYLINE